MKASRLYIYQPMLNVGEDKSAIFKHLERPYILIDDGPLIDRIIVDPDHAVTVFDPETSSFDTLKDMTDLRAEDTTNVLKAVFEGGDTTLTKDTGLDFIFGALLDNPASFDTLLPKPDKKSLPGHIWAHGKLERLFRYRVLQNVLLRPSNTSLKGTIHARLDRAVFGDTVCYVLGNLLASMYEGLVVIPDFGFYQHEGHRRLIRQKRLLAGINFFAEVPDFKNDLLLMKHKVASRCTTPDAEELAPWLCPHLPGTVGYDSYLKDRIA